MSRNKNTAVDTVEPFPPREPVGHRRVAAVGIVLLLIVAMVLLAFLVRHS